MKKELNVKCGKMKEAKTPIKNIVNYVEALC